MAKILLVDDDAKLAEQIKAWLSYDNHVVEIVALGEEALDRIKHYHFDLIVLDWLLPDIAGTEVCAAIRQRGMKMPILMLSARSSLAEKTTGLQGGADDYVTKPVAPKELAARIRALLRRRPLDKPAVMELADLYLDPATMTVRKGGCQIVLQPKELQLLQLFMKHPNEVLSNGFIMQNLGHEHSSTVSTVVKAHVHKLRTKFEEAGQPLRIDAVYGKGYVLVTTGEKNASKDS